MLLAIATVEPRKQIGIMGNYVSTSYQCIRVCHDYTIHPARIQIAGRFAPLASDD